MLCPRYGWIVLCVEILTATSSLSYAVLLCRSTRSRGSPGLEPVPDSGNLEAPPFAVSDKLLKFHVRILVPCYKETLEVVRATVEGALRAELPENTRRTVYVCDDGERHYIGAATCASVQYIGAATCASVQCADLVR
jgi:endoglucanase